MLKLLRADFYRLFRSKSFYICTLVAIALSLMDLWISYVAYKTMPEQKEVFAAILPDSGIDFGIKVLANGNVEMLLSIIIAIFITAEFSHGTMKNVVSKGYSKIKIYFSKYITMLTATYIVLFLGMIIGTINATFTSGKLGDFNAENVAWIFKSLGIEIVLNAAFVAILVLVSMIVRNLGGVIAINILGVMTVMPLIFMLLQYIAKGKIKFTEYDLFTNITTSIAKGTQTSDLLRAVIVGCIYFILMTGIGIFAFKKSDIK